MFICYCNVLVSQNFWEQITIPDTIIAGAICADKQDTLVISAKGNSKFRGLLRSFDGGANWESLNIDNNNPNLYITTSYIKYDLYDNLFLATSIGIYKSTDNGDNFQQVYNGSWGLMNIEISSENDIYVNGWNLILRSQDSGITWDTIKYQIGNLCFNDLALGLNGEIYSVAFSFDGPGTGNGFHRTFDDGLTWENTGIVTGLYTVNVNADGGILVGGYYGVESSDDFGNSWTHLSNIEPEVMKSYENDKLIAGRYINGVTGCWFSEDWGNTWQNLDDESIDPYVYQISVSPSNQIYLINPWTHNSHKLFRTIDPILNNNENPIDYKPNIFPNPAENKLFINEQNEILNCRKAQIFDLSGNLIFNAQVIKNSIDISILNPGVYIIYITTQEKTIADRFIKK